MSILAVALLDDHAGHALDALSSVVLVVSLSGHVLEILHVRANEHVPQLHEIAVCWVFHCRPQSEDQLHNTYTRSLSTFLMVHLYRKHFSMYDFEVFV